MLPFRRAAALAALVVLLAVGISSAGAAPRAARRTRTRRAPPPPARAAARPPRPRAPVPAAPIDSVARAWADSAASAHGGLAAWQAVRDLSFSVRLTQSGPGGAVRGEASLRRLRRGARGGMYR